MHLKMTFVYGVELKFQILKWKKSIGCNNYPGYQFDYL